MSFTELDFTKLNKENRIKKIIFSIQHSLLTGENKNVSTLIDWFKKYEKEDLLEYKNNLDLLLEVLIKKLKSINPFVEDIPFDNNDDKKIFQVKIILDNIRSPFNVGSILRTAECFGLEEVIMCGITPIPELNNKIKKSMKYSPINYSYNFDTITTIKNLREQGYKIVSLEKCNNSIPIMNINFSFPLALIVGNEEFGLSKEILENSDYIIHIPIYGYKNSLNVAVATGIALQWIINKNASF